jgi:hypothetical protein
MSSKADIVSSSSSSNWKISVLSSLTKRSGGKRGPGSKPVLGSSTGTTSSDSFPPFCVQRLTAKSGSYDSGEGPFTCIL